MPRAGFLAARDVREGGTPGRGAAGGGQGQPPSPGSAARQQSLIRGFGWLCLFLAEEEGVPARLLREGRAASGL